VAGFRFIALALLAVVSCCAQFPSENERLMATARLWITVEYFHPYLAVRHDIDWDQALVRVLPKIRAAGNADEFRAALSLMLDELHDPETHMGEHGVATASFVSQMSLARTSTSALFVTKAAQPVETIALDVAGLPAVVRLSIPVSALPATSELKPSPATDANAYPSTEQRLLGAFKIWGAIHYFFAYKDLMDEDWDDVFANYLPKFLEARDATDYHLVVADLLTHLTDTNTTAHSRTLDAYFGESAVGLRMRLLDKFPIVTEVLDPAASKAGVRPGDVVKRIGMESTTDRFRRFVQYVPASTPQRSGYDTLQKVTSGPAGTEVELAIENAQGEAHAVKLTRGFEAQGPERVDEAIRVLSGNVGYMDLSSIPTEDAGAALIRLKDTKAIIFDLRGGRAPAADEIVSHLTSQTNVAAAFVTTAMALRPDIATRGSATETTSTFLVRTLPPPHSPLYKGRTVGLIDERTIGDAEYAGLLFEAANKTEFVGEPSAGAKSSVAELAIPGGIVISYSTQDIRHGNGGKLQRLGLQPSVLAPTTAKGLRAGKDEALDAALAHLVH